MQGVAVGVDTQQEYNELIEACYKLGFAWGTFPFRFHPDGEPIFIKLAHGCLVWGEQVNIWNYPIDFVHWVYIKTKCKPTNGFNY